MILIGTIDWATTRLRGMFRCPNCNTNQKFRLRASRPFLTIYFIPLVPIGGMQEFVQCVQCKSSFEPIVLANHMLPSETAVIPPASMETNFEDDLLRVIALTMIEDGHVTENEIRVARRLYENIAERNLSRDALGTACSQLRIHGLNTINFLNTARARLSHEQKLLLVQAMFGVAAADGDVTPGRMQSLLRSQQILGLDEREFESAIASTAQWLS